MLLCVALLLVSIISIALATNCVGLRLITGDDALAERTFLSPRIRYLSTEPFAYPIEGRLIYVDDKLPTVNVTGAIVLYKTRNLQVKERTCELLKDSGAKALIVQFQSRTDFPGLGEYSRRTNINPRQPFPVFEVTLSQSQKIQDWIESNNSSSMISIDGTIPILGIAT